MFRGAAVSIIYKQALLAREGSYDKSEAVSLMSTDVDEIAFCLEELNECWACFIEVVIGITLLTGQLGWVSLVPLFVVMGIIPLPRRKFFANSS
jgi:ATP-binding cassette subfamily C (CFTR/MRP) protein 1